MSKKRSRETCRLLTMAAAAAAVAHVTGATAEPPPAPPLPRVLGLAEQLTRSFNDCRIDAYSTAFADDLKVSENDKQVAADKATWMAIQRKRCRSQEAVVRSVNTSFLSVLVVDDVAEPRSFKPNEVAECCSYARATIYKLRPGDLKIVEALMLINEPGYWTSEKR